MGTLVKRILRTVLPMYDHEEVGSVDFIAEFTNMEG